MMISYIKAIIFITTMLFSLAITAHGGHVGWGGGGHVVWGGDNGYHGVHYGYHEEYGYHHDYNNYNYYYNTHYAPIYTTPGVWVPGHYDRLGVWIPGHWVN